MNSITRKTPSPAFTRKLSVSTRFSIQANNVVGPEDEDRDEHDHRDRERHAELLRLRAAPPPSIDCFEATISARMPIASD